VDSWQIVTYCHGSILINLPVHGQSESEFIRTYVLGHVGGKPALVFSTWNVADKYHDKPKTRHIKKLGWYFISMLINFEPINKTAKL